ncbi:MAG: cation transporter, partial [Lachnospiraceae bacterium]|nr:cation transporter [Lachnospiraceae bacterium]
RIREIVFKHSYIRQIHGFYLIKEKKTIRFDLVISFDAKDRLAVYNEVIEALKKEFPGYTFQVALDTDYEEI